ncbi:MAG TPA: FG-GAP-like repeat-containing protein, partial [Burkholderiales bacterium]|nr:FG-GAP-like repeat-containing protein [Burkholderiales bacterium]
KFIQTFLVYYGGGPTLVASDAPKLAKFDLLDIDRFRYNQLTPGTWSAVKAFNPNLQIYLYEMGAESQSYMDANPAIAINGLGRHNVSRGHSMGSLNGNHPELFQLDTSGNRIYNAGFSNVAGNQFWYLMDFGNPAYQAYWVEAVRADIANQPWVADGVHADNCLTFSAAGGYSATSSKYPTDAAWSNAMNSFTNAITVGLHGFGQKLWCNKGATNLAAGVAAWRALDAGPTPPDVMAEEGAFAVTFGPWATQFVPEANWKLQVDVLGAIQNSKVAMFSSTTLSDGQSGTDNWGQPVTYLQTLWYALGSYLLGKNDTLNNAYFGFFGNGGSYDRIWWFDEYDHIDLGKALGAYTVTPIAGVNIYSREFQKGYVLVNPTATSVASVTLPQAGQQLTHANLLSALSSIPIVNAISLNGHNAAIILKPATAPVLDTTAPTTPSAVSASAISSSQINLSWSASTDNVGVTGYRVYRAGAVLATLGAVTAYQNTGLTASTSYSYTVQAFDAAGNASLQSASASATTAPVAPDTAPPSVPTNLRGTAVSPTQINLAWNASTDNVAVTGYRVYLNDVALTTTTATSFQHTGLTASTTYNYRVSAFDAASNNSAWTATPVSVTTPARRVIRGSDFNADGKSDILWRNATTGQDTLWLMNGATISSNLSITSVTDSSWSIAGAGDFDGDGKSDILWRNSTTGQDTIWFMNGATVTSGPAITAMTDLNWSIAGVGDFDGNGKSDILWRNRATGDNAIWLMNGATVSSSATFATVADPNWSIAGVGDFDGNGKSDILWRNRATGENTVWFMNGASISSGAAMNAMADLNWSIAGVGDFDADGKSDVLWHNNVTGENTIWLMNGATLLSNSGVFATVSDPNWSIAGVGDLNGDGKSDILWHNSATGENAIWFMNGGSIASGASTNVVQGSGWSIILR